MFGTFILKQYIFDEFIKVHVRLVELDKLAYLVYWNMFVKSFLCIGIYIFSVFLIKEIIIRGWVKIKIKIAEGQRSTGQTVLMLRGPYEVGINFW